MSWSVIPGALCLNRDFAGTGENINAGCKHGPGWCGQSDPGLVTAIPHYILAVRRSVHYRCGLAAVLNLYAVARYTGWRSIGELVLLRVSPWWRWLQPYLSYRFLISLAGSLTPEMANGIATLGAIFIGIIIYGIALLFSGSLTRDEINLIPRIGPRLVELAERWRLLK